MKSTCSGLLLVAAFGAGSALAQSHAGHDAHHGHGTHAAHDHAAHAARLTVESQKKPGKAVVTVADLALLDQHGQPRNVKADVVGERIVVVDFVYTTCTTVCPVLSATFSNLQKQLGETLGKDVSLVSISIDPVRDTPAALKAYGERIGSRDGWVWLTGSTQSVGDVLKGFGAYVADPSTHPSMVLVGDGRSGQWTRFFGFPSAAQLMAKVEELRNERRVADAGRKGKNG